MESLQQLKGLIMKIVHLQKGRCYEDPPFAEGSLLRRVCTYERVVIEGLLFGRTGNYWRGKRWDSLHMLKSRSGEPANTEGSLIGRACNY